MTSILDYYGNEIREGDRMILSNAGILFEAEVISFTGITRPIATLRYIDHKKWPSLNGRIAQFKLGTRRKSEFDKPWQSRRILLVK